MTDGNRPPLKPARMTGQQNVSFTNTHTPVLLPIAAPLPALYRGSIVPGLAASLALMIVMGVAAFGLMNARQDLNEGRSAHVERPAAP